MSNDQNLQVAYIKAKREWLAQNPMATPEQIEVAIQQIARKLGL
jgi:hypothetical protein